MRWLALGVLASAAWAQGVPFDRGAIAMLPGIEEPLRRELYRIHGAVMRDVARAQKRLGQVDAQLKEKADQELRAERARLQERVARLCRQLEQRVREAGLDDAQVARLERMPRGALREERYNHGVLREVDGLSQDQRALLECLVTATDAAQAAIAAQKEHLVRGLEDRTLRRHIAATSDRQSREIEQRFWRAAYYALTPEQMRGARERFSPRYAEVPDHRRQLLLLPGLTPSQANRIRALFAELDSEVAADQAAMRRIRVHLRGDRQLSREERAELSRRNAEAARRAGELTERTRSAVHAVLIPEQRAAFLALPPRLGIGERARAPWELTRAMRLRPEQAARVRALQGEVGRAGRTARRERAAEVADLREAGLGPESPQMMTMEAMQQDTRSRIAEHHRDAGHRLLVEVLDPGQVAAWIVAPAAEF